MSGNSTPNFSFRQHGRGDAVADIVPIYSDFWVDWKGE